MIAREGPAAPRRLQVGLEDALRLAEVPRRQSLLAIALEELVGDRIECRGALAPSDAQVATISKWGGRSIGSSRGGIPLMIRSA